MAEGPEQTAPRGRAPGSRPTLKLRALVDVAHQGSLSYRQKMMLAFGLPTLIAGVLTFVGVRERLRADMRAAAETELIATRRVFENLVDAQYLHLSSAGRLIADAPKLRAAIETEDPETVAEEASWFRTTGQADVLAVYSAKGKLLSFDAPGKVAAPASARPAEIECALHGTGERGLLDHGGRLYMTVSQPVAIEGQGSGAVLIGRQLSDAFAKQIAGITGVQVKFLSGGQVRASSNEGELSNEEVMSLKERYAPSATSPAIDCVLVSSMTPREDGERRIERTMLAGSTACLAVVLLVCATLAGRLTRGLKQLVHAANEMARGNFDAPLTVPPGDEIGYLAHAMGELRASVAEQVRKLNRINEDLRGRIEEILFNETLGAQYDQVSILGRGGMGIVYRAHDTQRDQTVAIKVLSPMLAELPSVVQRFMREGEILKRLEHPALVRTIAVEQSKLPYCEMEYFEGKTLGEIVKAEGPMGWTRVQTIADRLLSALAYCHAAGVIHRDVKPSNVLVGEGDQIKLIDFGLARDDSLTALTHSREAFGTPDYTAPEQERGLEVDARADIFSMGQTLYYLLTGQVVKLRAGYVSVAARRPASLADAPPAGVDAVIAKALAPDATERWPDCEAMRRELFRV